jgi:NAD(P)-dependent dehydrogenase (short-subunit alcohol dehydrogenase family)
MDLKDRVALITGGKRIGSIVAIELARRGMHVALAYNRSKEEADETAAAVRAVGRRAVVLQADLSRGEACKTLVDQAAASLGRLDVLINMASVYASVPFSRRTRQWDAVVNVDLKAAFLCARAAVGHMRRRRPDHQFLRLDRCQRPPRYKLPLPSPSVGDGTDRGAALELAEIDTRQCDRARTDPRA